MLMEERRIASAPNIAIGQPFSINGVQATASTDRYTMAPPSPAR